MSRERAKDGMKMMKLPINCACVLWSFKVLLKHQELLLNRHEVRRVIRESPAGPIRMTS